jgi:glucose-6-phosphate 1-epimerase
LVRIRPAHGFVRTRPWRVLSAHADENGTRLTLTPDEGPSHPAWPHTAEVSLEIGLGASLMLSLSTHNTGPSAFLLTQALHSYFRVQDISNIEVDGLQRVPFIDQLDPGALKAENGPVRIAGEVDRIYQDITRPVTIVEGGDRRIAIQSRGSASAVLWNPWIEKAVRLGDMGADGHRHMVCVETANAGADVITLAPGARHTLTVIISASMSSPPA